MTREEWIDKIVADCKSGEISADKAMHYLEFIDWRDQYNGYRKDKGIKARLTKEEEKTYNDTLESDFFKNERDIEIEQLIIEIREYIGQKDFNLLCTYYIDEWSQEKIAKRYSTNKMAISRKIKTALKKCLRFREKASLIIDNPQFSRITFSEGGFPRSRFPFEVMKEVSIHGHWWGKRYISEKACKMNEYLNRAFGDNETKCSFCFGQFSHERECANEGNL